ncbi:hypothetical protein KL905_003304 [Ogataea polymorpha]|uniref:uncharacterized protein n=1 Tax=Ogataea polymorpha TaxID=460523 RepID=UPI0007F55CED|nr:uncharacterized protein OGAPODRAFT_92959 [Ogataea polymorpha]KAG7909138.1 hypothetical protein KL906_002632 [Ogataea polymorpha]KAG7920670.1 hypothetical protein KL905_003304 [Ogataea polymorpha]KAG7926360.1 hypothetical protein KL925_003410 [Ogataea polymorpha]KAG7935692.1 hypothetical protein KL934_002251 [Ogataea polymorpha]OBA17721.1 hypothetical protein OGAPODRAFT_92959 [Ogataea polymorpha]
MSSTGIEVHGSDLFDEHDQKLMQRIKSQSELNSDASLEERVLERFDRFLAKLESRIEDFEKYFTNSAYKSNRTHYTFFEALKSIKAAVIQNQQHNLQAFGQILDRYYGSLLDEKKEYDSTDMYAKISTGLQFLDEKIDLFEKTFNIPLSPQEHLGKLKEKLYNFDKAVAAGSKRLLHFYELPFQWRENKYIIYGYRFNSGHLSALKSVFQLHNETANIWTHILGSLLLLYIMLKHYPATEIYARSSFGDKLVTNCFFLASIKCLMSSVVWHTYDCISQLKLRKRFACIDYTGITVLITASIITTEHIALKEFPAAELGFISFSTIAGIVGVLFTWSEFFDKPESRPVRILFFISLSALGVAAFCSSAVLKGLEYSFHLYAPLLKSFVWYLTGVQFYGTLVPERWRNDVIVDKLDICDEAISELEKSDKLDEYLNKTPDETPMRKSWFSMWWVDYVFSSHHIWHIFVLLGVLGHYSAILEMFSLVN